MCYDIIMTGFGGQGVQTISLIVAHAAMEKGLHVTYLPSYGVEKRGGRTNVYLIVSDDEIGSPITNTPQALIALDAIGLSFFQKMLSQGSLLIANTSLTQEDAIAVQEGVRVLMVRFNEEAAALGNPKLANMITLGCFLEETALVSFEDVCSVMEEVIPERLHRTIPENVRAIDRGIAIARALRQTAAGRVSGS